MKIPETIKVKGPTASGYMIINKRDFNPGIHEVFVVVGPEKEVPLLKESEPKKPVKVKRAVKKK